MLAGNTGKARMNAFGTLRQTATWSTFVLLSGEKSLEQKVTGDEGRWSGGMAARFTDIDVTDADGKVPAAMLEAIRGAFANYGHAGPHFVEKLGELSGVYADALRHRILKLARKLAFAPPGAPQALAIASVADTSATLVWRPAKPGDLPISGYRVFRGDTVLRQVTGTSACVRLSHRCTTSRGPRARSSSAGFPRPMRRLRW